MLAQGSTSVKKNRCTSLNLVIEFRGNGFKKVFYLNLGLPIRVTLLSVSLKRQMLLGAYKELRPYVLSLKKVQTSYVRHLSV